MNAASKSLVFASLTAGLFAIASVANAAPPHVDIRLGGGSGPRLHVSTSGTSHLHLTPGGSVTPRLRPIAPATPTLGFYGHFDWGVGMHVDSVPFGTPARRMGLERGDVIVAINGLWLRSDRDYHRAMAYSDHYVQVTVQDVRSGRLVTRVAHLPHDSSYYSSPVSSDLH